LPLHLDSRDGPEVEPSRGRSKATESRHRRGQQIVYRRSWLRVRSETRNWRHWSRVGRDSRGVNAARVGGWPGYRDMVVIPVLRHDIAGSKAAEWQAADGGKSARAVSSRFDAGGRPIRGLRRRMTPGSGRASLGPRVSEAEGWRPSKNAAIGLSATSSGRLSWFVLLDVDCH